MLGSVRLNDDSQCIFIIDCAAAREGKKVREQVRKLAKTVEEEDFDENLEMVRVILCLWFQSICSVV